MLRHVRARLPHEDVLYLADQLHAPYGDRAHEDLRALLAANLALLEAAGVDAIVMGCNTSCSIAARFGWPPHQVPVLDLIDAAAGAVSRAEVRRVGVLATTATAQSGAYGDAIRRLVPGATVEEVAAPALVPLVEAGTVYGDEPRRAVSDACSAFSRSLDAIVLACTHYPLLDAHFAAVLGPDVLRIDPALVQGERAAELVAARSALTNVNGSRTWRAEPDTGGGRTVYRTTGALEPFRIRLGEIIGELGPYDDVEGVETSRPASIRGH